MNKVQTIFGDKVDLNENEIKVVKACRGNEFEGNFFNGEFDGEFTDWPNVDGLTNNQIKGYLSDLKNKQIIFNLGEDDKSFGGAAYWVATDTQNQL